MFKILNLSTFNNKNGILTVAEFKKLDFKIKRIFSITASKNSIRGKHAHKECRQILFCPKGKIEVTLFNGLKKKKIILSNAAKGLLVYKKVWLELKFLSNNCFLIALCDQYFLEKDYIRNLDTFKKEIINKS